MELRIRCHQTARLPKSQKAEKTQVDESPWIYSSAPNTPLYTFLSARDTTPAAPSFPQISGEYKSEFELELELKVMGASELRECGVHKVPSLAFSLSISLSDSLFLFLSLFLSLLLSYTHAQTKLPL